METPEANIRAQQRYCTLHADCTSMYQEKSPAKLFSAIECFLRRHTGASFACLARFRSARVYLTGPNMAAYAAEDLAISPCLQWW